MSHEIIMPVLGMNQDTGTIAVWSKQPGDYVAEGDVVMEVETDKAVQEIESHHAGYLSEVKYKAGAEVPVGEVIAYLTDEPGEIVVADTEAVSITTAAAEPAPPDKPVKTPPLEAAKLSQPSTAPPSASASVTGKILASPKAKRLAAEEGLNLEKLVLAGRPQPFHAADIAELRLLERAGERAETPAETPAEIPVETPADGRAIGRAIGLEARSRLAARVDAVPFARFCDWLNHEGSLGLDRATVLAVFAAGTLRFCTDLDEAGAGLVVEADTRQGSVCFIDPDRQRFATLTPATSAQAPHLSVREMIGTHIVSVNLAGNAPMSLSVFGNDTELELEFAFDESYINCHDAIRVVTELATRLGDPRRQLL